MVKFNGPTATPTIFFSTTRRPPVSARAPNATLFRSVNGQASNGVSFTVIPPPSISSLSPISGVAGTSVTITGANYGATPTKKNTTVHHTPSTPTSWRAPSKKKTVPAGATTGEPVGTGDRAARDR